MGEGKLINCVLDELDIDSSELCGCNPDCCECYIEKIIEIIFPDQ